MTKIVAGFEDGYVWVSLDSGTTWSQQSSIGYGRWYDIHSSTNWSHVYVFEYNASTNARIFCSTNSFSSVFVLAQTNDWAYLGCNFTACSADGKYIAFHNGKDPIQYLWASTNYGQTFYIIEEVRRNWPNNRLSGYIWRLKKK